MHLPLKGRGRALKAVWAASPAAVLVYVDEDLSTDLAALEPLVAPLLSGHSDMAIGTRLAGSSRWCGAASASSSPAPTTCCSAARWACRSPTPSAGSRRSPAGGGAPAAAVRGRRLVLRHRAPGARRTRGAARPRGPGRLGRRRGLLRAHRVDRSRGPQGHVARLPRARDRTHPDRPGVRRHRQAALHDLACGDRRTTPAVRDHRRAVHGRLRTALRAVPSRDRCADGGLPRAAHHGDRQHRAEPPLHLRCPRAGGGRRPPRAGTRRVRHRLGDHRRVARPAAHDRARGVPRRRGPGAHRREPRRHPGALRPLQGVGVPHEAASRTRPPRDLPRSRRRQCRPDRDARRPPPRRPAGRRPAA